MSYITDYNDLETAIAQMVTGDFPCSAWPDGDPNYEGDADITKIFVLYRGSTFDPPEDLDSVVQKENLQFDFFIMSPFRAQLNKAFIQIQKSIVGKKLDGYERFTADVAGNFQYDDRLPAKFLFSVKTSRPSIWDQVDGPDVDNEDDGYIINNLDKVDFNE